MKYLSILFLLCFNLYAISYVPSWFPKNDYDIKSYGKGDTLNKAKKNAYFNFIKNNKELNNSVIDDMFITKKEIFENQFFIELTYNKKSIDQQLKDEIQNIVFKLEDETNNYLLNTKLMQKLYKTYGYYPDINISNNHIYFNNKIFIIKNKEFSSLLADFNSTNIFLNVKSELKNNEKYFIKINTYTEGFTSLIQVFNNKDVKLLFANKIYKPNTDIIYPNFKMSDGLLINLNTNEISKDIFTIAIICENKNDFSKFDNIYLPSKNTKNMIGDLINTIDNCDYATKKIIVKK